MTYNGIIYISNEIRFVLDTARQVNLAAQNASLAARRAGNARGFQAVSAELKVFSQGLAKAMHEMSQDILGISQSVSGCYRQLRFSNYYDTAHRLAGEVALLADIQNISERRQKKATEILSKKMLQLGSQVSRSIHICSNGRVLARSAMIEATSGGEWEAMLRNVASDIEHTIVEVNDRLKLIGTRLNTEQESL